MVYYDDGGIPSEAVKGLRKLVTVDKVHIILGPNGASQVNAACTVNEQEKVLLLANSGDTKTTKQGNKLIVRLQTVPSMVAGDYAKFLLQRGAKSICVLYDLTDWGVDWAESFKKKYENAGGKVLSMVRVNSRKETDFYPTLTQFKRLNPDAVLIVAWDEPSGLIAKQAREVGYKGRLCFTEQLRAKGVSVAGVDNVVGSLQGGGSLLGMEPMPVGMKKYVTAFEKKFPGVPPHGTGMLYHDALLTVCLAMEKSGTVTDPYKIRQACNETIAKIPVPAYGGYKGITPGGQGWGYETVIAEIGKDGKPQKIGGVPITYELGSEGEQKM
jgi:branched-chain amino acid transport system substrate-binding protein